MNSNSTDGPHEEPKVTLDNLTVPSNETKDSGKKILTGRDLGVWDVSLEDSGGLLSQWTLSFLTPLLRVGANKLIEPDDIGVPSKEDLADRAYVVTKGPRDAARKPIPHRYDG